MFIPTSKTVQSWRRSSACSVLETSFTCQRVRSKTSVLSHFCVLNVRQNDISFAGWHHATVNLGDTGAIARRPEEFTPGSPREIKERAAKAVNAAHWGKDPKTARQDAEAAVALANEAVALDPVEVGRSQSICLQLHLRTFL